MELVIHQKAGMSMKKAILLLMSVQFFVYLGFGIIIPILPEVIVQQGFSEVHVGGLLTIYALASFFTAPLWVLCQIGRVEKTYYDRAYRI